MFNIHGSFDGFFFFEITVIQKTSKSQQQNMAKSARVKPESSTNKRHPRGDLATNLRLLMEVVRSNEEAEDEEIRDRHWAKQYLQFNRYTMKVAKTLWALCSCEPPSAS